MSKFKQEAKNAEMAIKTLQPLVLQEHYDSMTEQQRNAMALAVSYAVKGLLKVAEKEIDDYRISWKNLKDTIPYFDSKISYLEEQLKSSEELVKTLRNERLEQKHKLKQLFDSFPIDMQEIEQEHERTVEVYKLGTKREFLAWLKKFEGLLEKKKNG